MFFKQLVVGSVMLLNIRSKLFLLLFLLNQADVHCSDWPRLVSMHLIAPLAVSVFSTIIMHNIYANEREKENKKLEEVHKSRMEMYLTIEKASLSAMRKDNMKALVLQQQGLEKILMKPELLPSEEISAVQSRLNQLNKSLLYFDTDKEEIPLSFYDNFREKMKKKEEVMERMYRV